jgi:hypothetical protein
MLDESEFLSPYGIRSLSRYHRDHPYVLRLNGNENKIDYQPAESQTGLFGGNSFSGMNKGGGHSTGEERSFRTIRTGVTVWSILNTSTARTAGVWERARAGQR